MRSRSSRRGATLWFAEPKLRPAFRHRLTIMVRATSPTERRAGPRTRKGPGGRSPTGASGQAGRSAGACPRVAALLDLLVDVGSASGLDVTRAGVDLALALEGRQR